MTKPSITQSQKRFQDSIGSIFGTDLANTPCDFVFLKSSTDIGVQRNGGRNGSCYAPQSFLSHFKKLNKKPSLAQKVFKEFEVSSEMEEKSDFHKAQFAEAERIESLVNIYPMAFFCHLGGGHDHIFPLLKSLSSKFKKIIVVNVDAHADTRTDCDFHSGTPFRQFSQSFDGDFTLIQIGLLPFANSESTLSPLLKGQTQIIWREDCSDKKKLDLVFGDISKKIDDKTAVIFSLDADALTGADVPGVSAVNGEGLTKMELKSIWKQYRSLPLRHSPIMGIYELNPVYDTLSMISVRTLAAFLYDCLD